MVLILASCSDDKFEAIDNTVEYGVAIVDPWLNGRIVTRAGEDEPAAIPDITVLDRYYPAMVKVHATPKSGSDLTATDYTISQRPGSSNDTEGYLQYHIMDPDKAIELGDIDNYTYTAIAQFPEPADEASRWNGNANDIPTIGDTDYLKTKNDDAVRVEGNHVLFTLSHQTALVRFVIKVDEVYAGLRDFRVTSLAISRPGDAQDAPSFSFTPSDDVEDDDLVTVGGTPFISMYVRPEYVNEILTVKAVYDVYDKDGQLTRKACTAANALNLTEILRVADDNGVFTAITPQIGHYYDIVAVLKPDFLYVLSDNDNKADMVLR